MNPAQSFLIVALTLAATSFSQPRVDNLINADWKFTRENAPGAESVTYNDGSWESVSLPHTWNARDGQDGGNDYYRGTGWYRRRLSLEPGWRGRSIFLKFDGAATSAQVFVNGTEAGRHKGNFGAFCLEVTKLLRFDGANVIAVKVNNARDTTVAPLRGDFTVFGGLYRGVHLLVLNPASISPLDYASTGVYVKQESVTADLATLMAEVHLRNANADATGLTVRCSIVDATGSVVAEVSGKHVVEGNSDATAFLPVKVEKPHLWNGRKDPYLYTVNVTVSQGARILDALAETVGLRSFSVDPEQGFFLNGNPYRLYGVNRHQDRENKGWAISQKDHEEDFALIREIGCTGVRLAHYQQATEFYDLCDRGGMIVWAELALVDDVHPSAQFREICRQQLTELIKQNYNHPAILFWSLQNELVPDNDRELYGSIVEELHALAKKLDPTRLTTVASRSKYGPEERINSASDLLAYNVYRGWYEGKPEDFATFVDKHHRDHPQRPLAISEYGAGASIHQHEWPARKPPTRGPWHPEEWQSVVHEVTWKAIAERKFLWGSFLWNMFDFGSDGRSEGERMGQNDKGLVSYDRTIKKDAFFFYKAQWNTDPMVYITSRRYSPRPAGATTVKAYSNCDSVELFLNGISLGTKSSVDRVFIWESVPLRNGKNTARVVGIGGGRRVEDACQWTVEPEN